MSGARTLVLACALAACLPRAGLAQPAADARLAVALDALAPGAFASETRHTFTGSLSPEWAFNSQRGRVDYQLEGGSYNSPGDWSFLSHALGASYRLDLTGDAGLHVGGGGTWRRNGDAWEEADYDAFRAFANLELRPRPGSTLRAGYGLALRSFARVAELDQREQDVFGSANVNLRTRTTLIAESHFGWKSYAREATSGIVAPAPAEAPSGSGHGGNGAGRSRVRATRPLLSVGGAGEKARQWNLLLRVAQGLADRTGLWAQGFVRRTGGRVPPALVATPTGFFDDGVYDDPFASDLAAVSGGLKHLFAGGAALQASGSWQRKDFPDVPAFDAGGSPLPGNPPRADRIARAGASLSAPLPGPEAFSLAIALEYGFTRSRSNDAFYDYRDHVVGLALTLSR